MVKSLISQHMSATVIATRGDTSESLLSEIRDSLPSDVFDFVSQAQGYFRFAVQEMDVTRIEIEVTMNGHIVEVIEITRD